MTQDVAIAILPRIGRIGVLCHFFISTTDSTDRTDESCGHLCHKTKNQDKPLGEDGGRCLACGSPLKSVLRRTAFQAEVWWCAI